MSAPKPKGRQHTMITATIPNPLMAEVRRYCDLYKMTMSRLVTEGLELRLGHREERPEDEPRYDMVAEVEQQSALLTAQKETLDAMRQTFSEDLKRFEQHIHDMTAKTNSNTANVEMLIKLMEHYSPKVESHEEALRQKAEITQDQLTAQENIQRALSQLAADQQILQANIEVLHRQHQDTLTRMQNAASFFVNQEYRIQALEGADVDEATVEQFRQKGRAYVEAVEKDMLTLEGQKLAQDR